MAEVPTIGHASAMTSGLAIGLLVTATAVYGVLGCAVLGLIAAAVAGRRDTDPPD
jgi:hypothetical protein